MTENEIGKIIVNSALHVHRNLGAGLLESTYQACLKYELRKSDLFVESEVGLPVVYEEVRLDCGYKIDLWIERNVIVEIKAVDSLNDIHLAQILTYLKRSGNKLGFLINFNIPLIKNGIRRVVNNL